jgi:hypothetical protein
MLLTPTGSPRPPADDQLRNDLPGDTPTPPDISEVVLLRPAATHGFDQSQRGLAMMISGTSAGTIDIESPPNPNLAPPAGSCCSSSTPRASRRSGVRHA